MTDRELEFLLSAKVMDGKPGRDGGGYWDFVENAPQHRRLASYLSDPYAAAEVVLRVAAQDYSVALGVTRLGATVTLMYDGEIKASCTDRLFARAISLCALKAYGVEVA
jgi:hypothetical protein